MLWELHWWILWTGERCEPGITEPGGRYFQRNHRTIGETSEDSHVLYTGTCKSRFKSLKISIIYCSILWGVIQDLKEVYELQNLYNDRIHNGIA